MARFHTALEQRISATLNAQLHQTLHVLGLGLTDLVQLIHDQCEQNPFLEGETFPESFGNHEEPGEGPAISWTSPGGHSVRPEGLDTLANQPEPLTRDDHITRQITLVLDTPRQRRTGFFLLEHMNDAGFMTLEPDHAALALGISREEVWSVLRKLQTLDPPGIFARTLYSSLRIQLREAGLSDDLTESIALALASWAPREALEDCRKRSGVSAERWHEAFARVRQMRLRPLEGFAPPDPGGTVIPDLEVFKGNGQWHVRVCRDCMPRVMLDQSLFEKVRQHDLLAGDESFVRQHWQGARTLVKAVNQRWSMIQRVGDALFASQKDFLEQGPGYLHPMTLQDLAVTLQVHVSTISRAVQHKYVQTPYGTFPLRFFFRAAMKDDAGTALRVQEKIRTLLRQENPGQTLSDQEIANLLASGEGIRISRRTVQKYRDQMRIPSASLRQYAKSA
jgi:RNA polymerase sigma-54 factor